MLKTFLERLETCLGTVRGHFFVFLRGAEKSFCVKSIRLLLTDVIIRVVQVVIVQDSPEILNLTHPNLNLSQNL